MNFIRYEESRPQQMREMMKKAPVAYVPLGALEWHGEHGPLGLDGLKAHALCEAAAEITGGVVFPSVYWGAFGTVPFPFTFHFKKSGINYLVRESLRQLEGMGFMVVVLLTGHYPPAQIKLLRKECRRFNKKGKALALGAPEQVFAVDLDYFGDHAGMWETSLMLAIRPELVDLTAMPKGLSTLDRLKLYGVMGQDPAEKAGADKGRRAITLIASNLAAAVERALKEGKDASFEEAYKKYDRALIPFSRKIFHVIREALDVHSLPELIRYGLWSWKNLGA
jgi:creatinine amidohydrolase